MKTLFRVLTLAGMAAAPMLLSSAAYAQFAKAEDAVAYRESVMTVMSSHFGRIGPVVKGERPYDAAQVQADVALVAILSKLPWAAFGTGTEGGRAKPDVWADNAKFKQRSDAFQENVAKLATAAQSGKLEQVRTAFGDTAASCKACHDAFRKPK